MCVSCAPFSSLRAKKWLANHKWRRASDLVSKENAARMNNALTNAAGSSLSRTRSQDRTSATRRRVRAKEHAFTLGIEEEFQIIDPETRELRVAYSTVSGGRQNAAERTCQTRDASIGRRTRHGDCADAACARQRVIELRSELAALASRDGVKTASASKLFAALVHKSEITRGRNAARSALRTARMSITSWVSAPATGLK